MTQFKLFTPSQKNNLLFRKLKIGSIYMLPRYGFTAYNTPASDGVYFDTNPFTRSLDAHPVKILEISDGYVKVEFLNSHKGKRPQFWLKSFDLEYRGVVESFLLSLVMTIPLSIYNFSGWVKSKLKQKETSND